MINGSLASSAITAAAISAAALLTMPERARAESFEQIRDASEFVQLVAGRTLRYPGVRLTVSPAGEITGRGLGIPVRGQWQWQGNYFCRDLYWGEREIGPNCQAVLRNGDTLRFVSDRGTGQSADFRLR